VAAVKLLIAGSSKRWPIIHMGIPWQMIVLDTAWFVSGTSLVPGTRFVRFGSKIACQTVLQQRLTLRAVLPLESESRISEAVTRS
jgi:hypothetical protein